MTDYLVVEGNMKICAVFLICKVLLCPEGPEWKTAATEQGFSFTDHGNTLLFLRVTDVNPDPLENLGTYYISATECPQWLWTMANPAPPIPGGVQTEVHDQLPNRVHGPSLPVNNVNAPYIDSFLLSLQARMPGVQLPTEDEGIVMAKVLQADRNLDAERRNVERTLEDEDVFRPVGAFPSGGGLFDVFSNVDEMCLISPPERGQWPRRYVRRGGALNVAQTDVGPHYRYE